MRNQKMTNTKLLLAAMLLAFLTMILGSMSVLAQSNVEWKSNTRNGEITAPEGPGIGSSTVDWGSQSYTAPALSIRGSNTTTYSSAYS